jgi:Zn-dependent peptidase ImmA (M78 family)
MPSLRTSHEAESSIPNEEIVETLLLEAGAANQLPTDPQKLLRYLKLEQLTFDFAQELQVEGTRNLPHDLRAVLSRQDRVVATHSGMAEARTRFSIFHEIGHFVLPEHHDKLFVDDDRTLSWWTKSRLEREANRLAADLLFQANRFSDESLTMNASIQSVLELAPRYGASYEAGLRRFTERHILPVALVVYKKATSPEETYIDDDQYSVHYTITSPGFRKLYFSSLALSDDTCSASEIYEPLPFLRPGQVTEKELIVEREKEKPWRFETEIFNNGYKLFQFLIRPVVL